MAAAVAVLGGIADVDGLCYPSSMSGTTRAPDRPALHGYAVALFGAARSAFPAHPALNLALDHPGIGAAIAEVAERLAYRLLP